jgi:hypothetical protein
MATLTSTSETTPMNIVSTMAAITLLGELGVLLQRLSVTGVAMDFAVNPLKGVFGLGIMIEIPKHPSIWVVTSGALIAEASFVGILVSMTSHAVDLGV